MKVKKFNGERLKSARTYRGLTVAQLAEKLNLQRQTVSMYENNKLRNPSMTVLQDMSKQLDFPVEFFLQQDIIKLKVGSTYFRSLLTTSKRYRNEQVQKIEFISQIYSFLNEYVEFPRINLPKSEDIQGLDIEDIATKLRKYWNLNNKPIDNLIYVVEQNGIIVTGFESENNSIDAFSQLIDIDGKSQYLIGFSKNKSTAARIHFDIAHELGHLLLHEWSEDIESLSKDDFKFLEKQANEFAGAFLLPKEEFAKDIGIYADNLLYYIELKKKWKVSISAMIRRAYNLNLINYFSYQQLMRTMQKKGIKKEEPLDNKLFTAMPALLKTSVQMLLDGGVFTAKEFIEQLSDEYNLSLLPNEIELLLDLPKDTLYYDNIIPIHTLALKRIK